VAERGVADRIRLGEGHRTAPALPPPPGPLPPRSSWRGGGLRRWGGRTDRRDPRGPSPPTAFLLVPRNSGRPLPQLRGRGGVAAGIWLGEGHHTGARGGPSPRPPPRPLLTERGRTSGALRRVYLERQSPLSARQFARGGREGRCVRDARPQGREPGVDGQQQYRCPAAQGARRSWAQLYRALLRAQPGPRSRGTRPNHREKLTFPHSSTALNPPAAPRIPSTPRNTKHPPENQGVA
jgi:hypothetical protein